MTNEEILQKLEEEILLRGFSPHTLEEYMLRAKSFMLYANSPLECTSYWHNRSRYLTARYLLFWCITSDNYLFKIDSK